MEAWSRAHWFAPCLESVSFPHNFKNLLHQVAAVRKMTII
jgi:hypothetical protein